MLSHHTDHLKVSLMSMGQKKFTVLRQSSEAGHVHSLMNHLLLQLPCKQYKHHPSLPRLLLILPEIHQRG